MPFGKHRDKPLEQILEEAPAYLIWLVESDILSIDQDVLDEAKERIILHQMMYDGPLPLED
jgi:hypothetical protein